MLELARPWARAARRARRAGTSGRAGPPRGHDAGERVVGRGIGRVHVDGALERALDGLEVRLVLALVPQQMAVKEMRVVARGRQLHGAAEDPQRLRPLVLPRTRATACASYAAAQPASSASASAAIARASVGRPIAAWKAARTPSDSASGSGRLVHERRSPRAASSGVADSESSLHDVVARARGRARPGRRTPRAAASAGALPLLEQAHQPVERALRGGQGAAASRAPERQVVHERPRRGVEGRRAVLVRVLG